MSALRVLSIVAAAGLWIAVGAAPLWADSAADQYTVAAGHYSRGRWQLAWDEFRQFLVEYPTHPQATTARFYAGETLVQLGRWGDAAEHFNQFLATNPPASLRRKAQFRVGEAHFFAHQWAHARHDLVAFTAGAESDRMTIYALGYLGEIDLAMGRFAEAETYYRRAVAINAEGTSLDEFHLGLARAYEAQAGAYPLKLADARQIYQELAATPGGPFAERATLSLGRCAYASGDYLAAASAFAALRKRFPDSASLAAAQLGEAQALYQLKRFDAAQDLLMTLVDDDKFAVEARYWQGLVHQAAGNSEAALDRLRSAAELAEEFAPHAMRTAIAYRIGEALLDSSKPAEAIEEFDLVSSAGLDDPWAEHAVAARLRAALAAKQYDLVDDDTALFVEHWPTSDRLPTVWQVCLRSLLAREQFVAAEQVATLRLREDSAPRYTTVDRYLLTLAQLGQRRWDAALTTLGPLLVQAPAELSPDVERAQAAALFGQEKFLKACAPLRAYMAAVADRPPNDDTTIARVQLCICYARTGRLDLARHDWETLLDTRPNRHVLAGAALVLAEAALTAGDTVWAADLFEALAHDDNPEPLRARAWWGVARSRYRAGVLAEGIAAMRRVAEQSIEPSLAAEARLLLAHSLEQQGSEREALDEFTRLIGQHETSEQLIASLEGAARLHDRLHEPALAANAYRRLKAEFPDRPHRDALLYNLAWAERTAGNADAAAVTFLELKRGFPVSRYWPDAVYRLAEHAIETDRQADAARLLDELLIGEAPDTILPHALYMRAQIAIAQKQWDAARQPMARLVDQFPDHALRPLAEFWQSEAAYRSDDFAAARRGFDALAARLVASRDEPWHAVVMLRRAQLLAQDKSWREARLLAESIATLFPDFEQQHEVDYLVGRCFAADADFNAARLAYHRAIESPTGAKSETAAMAQWMIGESYFHQRQYEQAIREYLRVEILYAYPDWQAAALLQAGKCHEALGQHGDAIAMYARLLKTYAETPWADEARRRLATAQEQLNRK